MPPLCSNTLQTLMLGLVPVGRRIKAWRRAEKCGFIDTGKETICPNLAVGADRPVKVMKLER
ncbi:MAG: hypothetical protein J6T53_08100 [Bacteroidales bacterium]|nr:hypothetical protein [Bacteroidales bacterium]